MKIPLPTDVIVFRCGTCQTNLPLNRCGSIILEEPLQEEMTNVLDGILKYVKDHHTNQPGCDQAKIEIHPILGTPTNICVSLPASDPKHFNDLLIGEVCYKANILIVNPDSKVIFALYQNQMHTEAIYSEFIKCNLNTILSPESNDTDTFSEDNLIYDDESVNAFQQMLPRLVGGGRSLRQDFNYVCLWCPKDDITKGKRGRFKELKNYREHFRKYHHGENGNGIPMTEFMKKLNRCEPTWFCKNCRQHYSLGNRVRHEAICKLETSESESESEVEMKGSKRSRSTRRIKKKNTDVQVIDINRRENLEEMNNTEAIAGNSGTNTMDKMGPNHSETTGSDTDSEKEIMLRSDPFSKSKKKMPALDDANKNQGKATVVINPDNKEDRESEDLANKQVRGECSNRMVLKEKASCSRETVTNNQTKEQERDRFKEVVDEFYISSEEEESAEADIEIKVEITEEENRNSPAPLAQKNLVRWWEKVPKHLYSDRGMGGPKIFLPSDSEEFVNTVTENYKNHMTEKSNLDEKMLLAEAGDAKFRQFSTERDQPFVDKYKNFVMSQTAKDVFHCFSDDYEELGLPNLGKSSTAKQYTNRIMEFFKYLANAYKNFHFDWMLDFKSKMEKNLSNNDVSYELFLPTKQDVTGFIKQFKYGSNPAANCGVRIFALKKLMDFISQEIKDNEHEFEGTLIDKSTKVECLLQKLKNLNSSICPDGTIKHLATASNKSHKRTLVDQLMRCPERSISAIMKGVSEYVESEEFNIEKTKLMELAYKKLKVPSAKEYMNSTNWLLEMLVCIGGNRPCALLGITLQDWEESRPGYCPFNQDEENDLHEEDSENDRRKILNNPYSRPKGSSDEEPTGVIVKSETDKIVVGPPCYIWFPNAMVELVKAHALITEKVLPRSVDIYHPKTLLFMNSNGKQIKQIDCNHLKKFIGLPIVAYDFRRSLSTFILDSKDDKVRRQESAVLRHKETTGYAYYYQKHSDNIEYVSIQYAMKHSLVKANEDFVDKYCENLKKDAANQEWELSQKRTDKSLEYSQYIMEKRKQSLKDAKQKSGRNWILPAEYESFVEGIEEAIRIEETKLKLGEEAGPLSQLLKYKPGAEGAGVFPPISIWFLDMYRVLYSLRGKIGDDMRQAELTVYDGVPFSLSGRKKIQALSEKGGSPVKDRDMIVANYWRDKIKTETRNRVKGKWLPLRFIFSEKDAEYYEECKNKAIKNE